MVQPFTFPCTKRVFLALIFIFIFMCAVTSGDLRASSLGMRNFEALNGWWIGSGRLGFKDGHTEQVTCRATYHLDKLAVHNMRQSVRCASTSGNVEIQSHLKRDGKKITGTWIERKYELSGQITGQFLPDGFRVSVSGKMLKAEMTITMLENKHVVEIRFVDGSLIGLSMSFSRQ